MTKRGLKQRLWTSHSVIALIDQGIVSVCNFLTTLLAARMLPTAEFGHFSLALLGILFLANMHRALITQPMNILGAAEQRTRLASRLLTLMRAHFVVIPVSALFLTTLATLLFPDIKLLLFSTLYIASYFLQELLRRFWYMTGQIKLALVNDLLSYGGQLLTLGLSLLLWDLNAADIFAIMAATSLLAFLCGLYLCDIPHALANPSLGSLSAQHWPISKWLLLTVLAVWGAGQVYPFLIAPMGPIAVATFSASRNILNVVGILIQSFSNYLPIHAARLLKERGKQAMGHHIVKTLIQTGVAGLSLIVIILLLAQPIMHLLYGGKYDHAAHILRLLSLGSACAMLGAALGAYSLAMEDSRGSFFANLGATVMTFTAGLYLIRTYGLEGAAVATSLSLATAMLLQLIFVLTRYRQLPERQNGA